MVDEVKENEGVEQLDEELDENLQEADEVQEEDQAAPQDDDEQDDGEEQKKKKADEEKARQAFLERRAREATERRQKQHQQPNQQPQSDDDELNELRSVAAQIKEQKRFAADKQVLTQLENEFKQEIKDYDDVINQAMEATKLRLIKNGFSEADALSQIEYEKVALANQAYREGKDPVTAIYNEAQSINSWIDELAEQRGYKKSGENKTRMQALREASKPNAMAGGVGRGANATKRTFADLDDPSEIADVPLRDLMGG